MVIRLEYIWTLFWAPNRTEPNLDLYDMIDSIPADEEPAFARWVLLGYRDSPPPPHGRDTIMYVVIPSISQILTPLSPR